MTGIFRRRCSWTLFSSWLFLVSSVLLISCHGEKVPGLDACRVSDLKLGMDQGAVVKSKSNFNSRRSLDNGLYELEWADGTAVCFDKRNMAVTIYGMSLTVNGVPVASKGMTSDMALNNISSLQWPKPTIVGPENHGLTSTPVSKMEYCYVRYRFAKATASVAFAKGAVKSVTLKSEP